MYQVNWREHKQGGPWLGSMKLPASGTVQIGRDNQSTLHLNHKNVSRSHAVIICSGNSIEVADVGSSNGSKLAGRELTHSAWGLGEQLVIGPYELQLSLQEKAQKQPEKPPQQPHRQPQNKGNTDHFNHRPGKSRLDGIDARPRYIPGADNLWSAAVHRRNAFAKRIEEILAQHNIIAELELSFPKAYPPSLTLACWLPEKHNYGSDMDVRLRSLFSIEIDVKPFHEHKFKHTVSLSKAGNNYELQLPEKIALFNENDLAEWVLFAINKRSTLYWEPLGFERLIAAFLPSLSFKNRIALKYRNNWSGIRGLVKLALWGLIIWASLALINGGPSAILPIFGAMIAGAYLYVSKPRQTLVCTPPMPDTTPSTAYTSWGSWDAVIPKMGENFELNKSRLLQALTEGSPERVNIYEEAYTYWTPEGFEKRIRKVVQHRQCEVQVHIYKFGTDLFVGWDAHLNHSQWRETEPVSQKNENGETIEFREIRPARYKPTEFDWIDLRGLADFVHRRLEQTIRKMLKEQQIDIELNFQINRKDIDTSGGNKSDDTKSSEGKKGFLNNLSNPLGSKS